MTVRFLNWGVTVPFALLAVVIYVAGMLSGWSVWPSSGRSIHRVRAESRVPVTGRDGPLIRAGRPRSFSRAGSSGRATPRMRGRRPCDTCSIARGPTPSARRACSSSAWWSGLAFILHGWPKIQAATHWMPAEAPVPGALQAAAAVSEFGGGIALILGLLTPLACLGLAGTMSFAILMVHMKAGHPFVDPTGGPSYELAAAYLASVVLLLLTGPGRFSLDAALFGRRVKPGPAPEV